MKIKNNYTVDETLGFIRFSDFPLATTLVCMDYKLLYVEADKGDSKRLDFVFEKTNAVELLIAGYWNSNLLVDPKKFWNASREIKSRIQSQK